MCVSEIDFIDKKSLELGIGVSRSLGSEVHRAQRIIAVFSSVLRLLR